jgi:hypothetical protein
MEDFYGRGEVGGGRCNDLKKISFFAPPVNGKSTPDRFGPGPTFIMGTVYKV